MRSLGVMKDFLETHLKPRWEIEDLALALVTMTTGEKVIHLLLKTSGDSPPPVQDPEGTVALIHGEDYVFDWKDPTGLASVRLLLWDWDDVVVEWQDDDNLSPVAKCAEESGDTRLYELPEPYTHWQQLFIRLRRK